MLARKSPHSIRRRDNLAGWLYGVAQRLARRARQSETTRLQGLRRVSDERLCTAGGGDPAWDELVGVLDEELRRLPERYRSPLLLCYLEGRTQDEAARQLNWSLSTLRRRLENGRQLLRGRMTRRGATLGAGLLASIVAPSSARAAMTAQLRQTILTAATSTVPASAVSAPVWLLVTGELRRATLTKMAALSALAVSVAVVLTAFAVWHDLAGASGGPSQPLQNPPAEQVARGDAGEQPQEPAPGHDLFNDLLPKGALVRLGTVEMRQRPYGSGLQFNPDGKSLISLGGGWIRPWDLATGKALVNLGEGWPNGFIVSSELASADGKVATSCRFVDVPNGVDFLCKEFDLEKGKERAQFPPRTGRRVCTCLCPPPTIAGRQAAGRPGQPNQSLENKRRQPRS